MNISNFSGGMISAAAYTRLRDITAVDAANVHHDDEGALITRNGYRRIPSNAEQGVAIFAHAGYVLVVTAGGELKWETAENVRDADAEASRFRSFIPARTGFDVASPTDFIADENVVFVSNANVQLKINFETGESPRDTAFPFYLPRVRSIGTRWRALGAAAETGVAPVGPPEAQSEYQPGYTVDGTPIDIDLSRGGSTGDVGDAVHIRYQTIKTATQAADHPYFYPIEAVGTSVYAGAVGNKVVLEINVQALDTDTDADFIDVFQTLSTAENADADYYFIGRIPYRVGTYDIVTHSDTDLATARELVEPLDTPAWTLSAGTEDRLYLNTGEDNKIWLTYHDTNETYFRTVRDAIPVNTGGAPITGLKVFQQSLLAVYTERRIYLLTIDPIVEYHRVSEVISTKDDRDAPIGCIAPESLVDVNGYHYFLAGNRQVYRFGGQRVTWVSDAINPTLVKIPRPLAKKAVGFARGLTYCLAYPSTPESTENDAIVCYDTARKIWWKDDLNLSAFSRDDIDDEYALIDGSVALLNTGVLDAGELIQWFWRGNKILIPLNTLIHSLFIGGLPEDVGEDAQAVSVTLKTEEGEQTQTMNVESAVNYWEQIVGFNLRGRSVQVTLSGSGKMKIDRLIFNPAAG